MRFSRRTDWDTTESDLARRLLQRQAAGLPLIDLTASNPTRCGFAYPDNLLAPLSRADALDYDPDPKGSLSARRAVSGYYADHSISVDEDLILLTTSTSEAYSYLLKLLCNPSDAILAPLPSYPLFDFLADVEAVRLDHFPLLYDHGWHASLDGFERAITPETRAAILVHPNNPTGHFTGKAEVMQIAEICRSHGIALIVDEVFLDYPLAGNTSGTTLAGGHFNSSILAAGLGIPVFVVSGISKICGLPQMKAAWIAASGPGAQEAMSRLEVIADVFLSMNAPVQRALPEWLAGRQQIQGQILTRTRHNLSQLDQQLASQQLMSRLDAQAGWYVVLRIPALQPDELTALQLLDQGVLVHPGYFFGFPKSGWLVISLLSPVGEFAEGFEKLSLHIANQESNIGEVYPQL